MNLDLDNLQTKIGVKFNNQSVLKQALIHRSFLNENRQSDLESNEKYEFLGDAVLELWISDTLFHQFPHLNEGDLTNLRALIVCTQNLFLIASDINLGQYIYFSKGEETHGGRQNQSILADAFESLIGAVFLDQGYPVTAEFLSRFFHQSISDLSSKDVYKDPKSIFQELAQDQRGITPQYKTVKESGPDHQKTFEVAVFLKDELIASGTGPSKQRAEEDASRKATKILTNLV
jgi:ribonuclease-3